MSLCRFVGSGSSLGFRSLASTILPTPSLPSIGRARRWCLAAASYIQLFLESIQVKLPLRYIVIIPLRLL